MKISELNLKKFLELSRKKEISPLDLVENYLKKIAEDQEKHPDRKINAIIYHDLENARKQFKALNASKAESYLKGAPIIVKNNFNVKNFPTECASKILKNYVSPYDGTVVKKIIDNGGIIWGYSNMDEFAMGSSNETSCRGVVRNPIHRDYIPGGSSGGSAASVKANHSLVALGSDTGGSIRQPAACCGIVGLKPTYGRVSRFGLVAFASSFDQIGPLTKTVEDSAILLKVIAGYDPKDNTSLNVKVDDYPALLNQSLKGIKIALPKEFFTSEVDPEVLAKVKAVANFYRENGAVVEEVSLPHTKFSIATYYVLSTAEASSNLARFDGVRYGFRNDEVSHFKEIYLKTRNQGFGKEVKRRMLIGSYVLSSGYFDAYYLKAQKVRSIIKREYYEVFKNYQAILTPTTPYKIFKIGEKLKDPVAMYLSDLFTVSANVSGIPGLSLPCGIDSNGLPISFQLLAPPFQEATILNLAHIYEVNNPISIKNEMEEAL